MRIYSKLTLVIALSFFGAIFFSGINSTIAAAPQTPAADPVIEEILVPTHGDGAEITPAAAGPSCFDYYHFQSVQVSVGTDKNKYAAGDKVVFSGELINQNDYPVVDGYVFVRVSKDNLNYATEGRYVVDEFFGVEKVALDAQATKNIQFDWRVPAVSAGKYHADYFFSVGKKFNLGGLPFSNEVTIGSADFEIESNNGWFYFDRAGTQVNGKKYLHIGGWPLVDSGSAVVITQPIINTFKQPQKISVKYELYRWDSLLAEDKLTESSEEITLSANAAATLSYTIPAVSEPVYYLKITASGGDQKSIVNIRVVSDLERPRLNYPSVTKFPLAKGDAFTLFTCFHNSSGADTSGKVLLTLSDKDGQEIGKMDYAGRVASNMMVGKSELMAAKVYDYLKLNAAVIDKDGKIVDAYETIYDCNTINPDKCQKTSWPYYVGAIAILLLIAAAVWWSRRRRSDLPIVAAGFLILVSAWYFQAPQSVSSATSQAKTQIKTVTGTATLMLGDTRDRRPILYWNASVAHSVSIDAATHSKNYSLAINDPISFTYSNVGTYNGTSGSWDTPYLGQTFTFGNGNVVRFNKLNPRLQYDSGFPVVIINPSNNRPWYQWGQDPAVYISSSNPSIVSCSTAMNCKAVGYGTATLTSNIALTRVALYNAYIWWDPCQDNPAHYWILRGGTCGRDMYLTGNSADLPATSMSWTITVPAPAVNGVCNNGAINGCSTGTFSDLTDSATAYQWQCLGSNGGMSSGTCSYPITTGAAKYKCSNNACTRDDTNGTYTESTCGGTCSAITTKYKCSNSACVQDNTNGTYTESTCANACGGGGGGGNYGCNSSGACISMSGGGFSTSNCDNACGGGGGGPARYKCSNKACTRDDTSGSYIASNCNSACSSGDGTCGDGFCVAPDTCSTCAVDCGACPPIPTYSLTSTNNLSINQIGTGVACSNKTTIKAIPFNGYHSAVTLAVGNWGGFAWQSKTFSVNPLTSAGYDSGSEFSVCAKSGASPGPYTLRIDGPDGKSVNVKVNVIARNPGWIEI